MTSVTDTPVASAAVLPAPTPQKPRRARPRVGTVLSLLAVGFILVLCAVGESFTQWPATRVVAAPYLPPGGEHLFGTDSTGMDVLARTLAGFRIDVAIGLATAIISTVLGMIIGLGGALFEKSRNRVLQFLGQLIFRVLDLMQALPAIIIGLVLVAFFGVNTITLIAAMVVALTPNQARLVRTEALRVSGEVYIENARVSGESAASTAFRYILPNSAWPALENTTLVFASSVALVAGLGFLGVGLAPPAPEWGAMISTEVSGVLTGYWWPVLFPSLAMMLTTVLMVALNRRLVQLNP